MHYVIQSCFEQWDNSHLHTFIIKKETYGNSEDDDYDKNEQDQLFEEVRIFLKKLNNMITDYVNETFEITTGILVRR